MTTRFWCRALGRLALAAISTAVALGCLELIFRRIVPQNGTTPFQSSTLEGIPYELRPDFETRYKGQRVRINELGFRGDLPRQGPELRIALVGDSVTFGNCIAEEATLSETLQRELKSRGHSVQALNCGVSGYNVENVRRMLEKRVMPLEPDFVIYVFVSNDVVPSGGPVEIPPDAVIDPYQSFPLRSAFLQFTGVRVKPLLAALGLSDDSGYVHSVMTHMEKTGPRRLRTDLKKMRDLARAADARFLVASYPFMVAPEINPFRSIEEKAEELCRELSIDFVNLSDAFEPSENLMNLWSNSFDSHPSAEANERTARLLADRVAERLGE